MGISFKKATREDMMLLFEWVNNDEVRKNSFSVDKISLYDHQKWYMKKINSNNCFIYIYYSDNIPIGQLRMDIEESTGFIDYSVCSEHRGKGFGTLILKSIIEILDENNLSISKIIGRVKKSNLASQKAFKNAEYQGVIYDDYIEYSKQITRTARL